MRDLKCRTESPKRCVYVGEGLCGEEQLYCSRQGVGGHQSPVTIPTRRVPIKVNQNAGFGGHDGSEEYLDVLIFTGGIPPSRPYARFPL